MQYEIDLIFLFKKILKITLSIMLPHIYISKQYKKHNID